MECLHGPGGKLDNRLVNLRWGTSAENSADTVRDGTYCPPPLLPGTSHPLAKLTEAIVAECRNRRARGARVTDLAQEFGVNKATMSNAIRGKTWRHV